MPTRHQTITAIGRQCLHLHLTDQIGPRTFGKLLEYFGTPQRILAASALELRGINGVGQVTAEAIRRSRDEVNVESEISRAAEAGVRIICRLDDDYPELLRQTPDPPVCLYVLGRLERQDSVALAIVGARRATHYGQEQARRFGYLLGQAGFTVVSGMARGVDSWAHIGALDAGGRTIAVLGNGLSHIYPPENAGLRDRIAASGAVISELPMTIVEDRKNFPVRNRIIAALSLGTLVIEAGPRSGALSTAAATTDYNRELFALPGRVDSEMSFGTNALIRDGAAKLTTNLEDILQELQGVGEALRRDGAAESSLFDIDVAVGPVLDETERRIVEALGDAEATIDQLIDGTGLPPGRVSSALTMLQLKAAVKALPGGRFVRVRRTANTK